MIRAAFLFGTLLFAAAQAAPPEIIATKGQLRYSSGATTPPLGVKAKNGSDAYILSLVRVPFGAKRRGQFELVLHRPGDKPDALNLLDPKGDWLDSEEYEIAAEEFSRGFDHAYHGPHIMWLEALGLEYRFSVVGAKVHPIGKEAREFDFDNLVLSVEVRPWKSMSGKPCDGVDRQLPASRKAALQKKIARELKDPPLEVLESLTYRSWHIVFVGTSNSDPPYLFYRGDPLKGRSVAGWSGAAATFEEEEMFEWARAEAPGIPFQLARCFAFHVTKE